MSDRYIQLQVYDALYTGERAPVIIAAAALLKDTAKDTVLAQLKFKSISNRTIKALTALVFPFDTKGQSLGDPIEHLYLDLKEGRDSVFGQKDPIHLPDNTTRNLGISIKEVVFEDNTTWEADSMEAWIPLSKPEILSEHFNDDELVKQYSLEYGDDSVVFPLQTSDLWYCKCGTINHLDEDKCRACGAEKDKLFGFDLDDLTQKKDERLQKEAEQRAEAEEKTAAEKAKLNKRLKVIVPCAVAAIVALAVFFGVVQPKIERGKKYDKAVSLFEEKKYDEAIEEFDALRDYKDSKKWINKSKTAQQYEEAKTAFAEEDYEYATELFSELDGYEDSEDLKHQAEQKAIYSKVMHGDGVPIKEAIQSMESIDDILTDQERVLVKGWKKLAECDGDYKGQYVESSTQGKQQLNGGFVITLYIIEGKPYDATGSDLPNSAHYPVEKGRNGYDYSVTFDDNSYILFSAGKLCVRYGSWNHYYTHE